MEGSLQEQVRKQVKKAESQMSGNSPIENVKQLAPDLNGDKQTELTISPTPMDVNIDVKEENEAGEVAKLNARAQGRKRKYSESKSDDATTIEDIKIPASTETPAEIIIKTEDLSDNAASDLNYSSKSADIGESAVRRGKRARIPNKRYDVTIASGGFPGFPKQAVGENKNYLDEIAHLQEEVENGDTNINSAEVTSSGDIQNVAHEEQNLIKDNPSAEITSSSAPSRLSLRTSVGGTPGTVARKQKSTVDLTNPIYLKPFDYGWKRELVYRSTINSSSGQNNGDIYYYTPSGKKVRSMREVSENLKEKALTLDNFTFFKEPIGLGDPEKEIIRVAKVKGLSTSNLAKKVVITKPKTPKTPKTPKEKILSPKPTTVASPKLGATSPKVAKSPNLGGFKVKLPGRGTPAGSGKSKPQKKNKNNVENDEVVSGMLPPNYTSPPKKTPSRASARPGEDAKPCQPCSIRCLGVAGLIPNLQCRLCLCLYHNECVGLSPLEMNSGGYVCKNCQLVSQDPSTSLSEAIPSIAPSPLTPLNALKTHNTQSMIPSKLQQRILRPAELANGGDPSKMSRLNKYTANNNYSENKSLVGSVTTWFPPSSTIQVGNAPQSKVNENNVISTPRPQHFEYLGDRRFLIIPKHNVLSFSPTIATAASTPVTRPILSSDKPSLEANLAADVPDVDSATCPKSTQLTELPTPVLPETQVPPITSEPDLSAEILDKTDQSAATQDVAEAPMDVDVGPSETLEVPKPSPKAKKSLVKPKLAVNSEKSEEGRFMDNYLQNLAFGYNTLLYVFQHLKVQDLLRAGCVCTMWRDIARHTTLWRTVRMKNSQIYNFEGLADALEKYGTINLDLRKMLLPNTNSGASGDEKIWPPFSKAIARATSLKRIELCRCPANVIENLAISNPLLEVINAVTIKCDTMSLSSFSNLKNLQELRLKSTAGFSLTSDLSSLKELKHLKILSLTSIKDLHSVNIEVIGDLENLESLDLGECTDFPEVFGTEILAKLTKLEKLRLEKGQGSCCTFEILGAVKNVKSLELLELVNFDIKTGFDKALGACTNIKKLLIIPTYISQSATTNHMVLGGVLRLQSTLSQFVWGVTLELLRVTELFVDQCDQDHDKKDKKKEKKGDSIPVLKPVPLLSVGSSEISPAEDPPQVEILPLPTLQKLLLQSLPTTRVKILKIPFHATWRQSIVDTVN